jgi:hypothetical protein
VRLRREFRATPVIPSHVLRFRDVARDAEYYPARAGAFPTESRTRLIFAGFRTIVFFPASSPESLCRVSRSSAITLACGMAILAGMGWWAWMLFVLLGSPRRAPA